MEDYCSEDLDSDNSEYDPTYDDADADDDDEVSLDDQMRQNNLIGEIAAAADVAAAADCNQMTARQNDEVVRDTLDDELIAVDVDLSAQKLLDDAAGQYSMDRKMLPQAMEE